MPLKAIRHANLPEQRRRCDPSMIPHFDRVVRKIRREGLKGAGKAAGRWIHSLLFPTDWDFALVPQTLERVLQERGTVTIVQIGANVGDTGSDQVCGFLKKHCAGTDATVLPPCRAVLVEPVRHLYQRLVMNYANCRGIVCVNAAIAENRGHRDFFRLREGLDLVRHGLPPWAEQLGSFLREQMESLWAQDPTNQALRDFVQANIVVEKVPCLTLQDLIAQHQITEVDLLQIDTEGYDYQILRTLDFRRVAPRYINYERIHLRQDEGNCRRLLLQQGYALHDHGQDTFCVLGQAQGSARAWREAAYAAWLDAIY